MADGTLTACWDCKENGSSRRSCTNICSFSDNWHPDFLIHLWYLNEKNLVTVFDLANPFVLDWVLHLASLSKHCKFELQPDFWYDQCKPRKDFESSSTQFEWFNFQRNKENHSLCSVANPHFGLNLLASIYKDYREQQEIKNTSRKIPKKMYVE